MSQFSDFAETKIIDHFLRATSYTAPTTQYIALYTAVTGLETNLPTTELVLGAGAYARMVAVFRTATAGTSENQATITFPTATANWGTITHVAVVDHTSATTYGTAVNVWMWGTLTTAKTVNSGDTFSIGTGDLDIAVQ